MTMVLFFHHSRLVGSILALWLSIASVAAHPDLIDQITNLTKRMDELGESSALYRQRADLFRRHGQFDAALADIVSAEQSQTNSPRLNLERAHVLSDAGRAMEAYEEIQPFLTKEPAHGEALIIRARCHAKLGRAEAAIADYTAAIPRCPAPGPDLFLERATQQAKLGKLDEAVRGLDEALTNSTAASPLQLAAIEYDRQRGAFDSALARVDAIAALYPVKEPWLTLRAEVLEQAGRIKEAEHTFQQIITGLETYSPLRRTLDLTKQLEFRARQGYARTQSKSPASLKS